MKRFILPLLTKAADEDGIITVIVALSMTAIMIFTAFVTDLGIAYIKSADIQNAADAASLAAGQLLPVNSVDETAVSNVKNEAIAYAGKNGETGLTTEDVTLGDLVNGIFTSVRVSVPCTVESFFAKAIGINSFSFSRSAKAKIAPSMQTSGVAPLGVDYIELANALANNGTQHIYLKYGGGGGTQGSYGAIDLDGVKGGGANDFTSWLDYGYDGVIKVGDDLLPVEKGNMAGPTTSAISERFNACTHFQDQGGCTADHYDLDCPRILKVLVIEKIGSSYVKVHGFAAFVIEGVGTNGEVLGSYIKYIDNGNVTGSNVWSTADYGMYNVGLVS